MSCISEIGPSSHISGVSATRALAHLFPFSFSTTLGFGGDEDDDEVKHRQVFKVEKMSESGAAAPPPTSATYLPLKSEVVGHIVANSIFQFLVLTVVAARVASRIYLGSGLGADDWLILVATTLSIGLFSIVCFRKLTRFHRKKSEVQSLTHHQSHR